jgi:NAD(P)H-hydrate epimerase
MKIADTYTSRACDREMIETLGYPSFALMENAAKVFTDIFLQEYNPKPGKDRILILSGNGNNGGDGLAIARMLHVKGFWVEVSIVKTPEDKDSDIGKMYSLLKASGLMPQEVLPDHKYFDYLLDALMGTGVEGELRPGTALDWIQRLKKFKGKIVAVDLPSGLNASTGKVFTEPLKASLTISFNSAKYCHYIYPAAEYCGKISIADIGILPKINDRQLAQSETADSSYLSTHWKGREKNSHKGSGGHLLICGGSEGMPGSVSLAVKAAFRSGSGKVSLLAPEKLKRDLHKKIWELMSLPAFPEDLGCLSTEHLSIWEKNQTRYQAAAIGPGMESADESAVFVKGVLETAKIPLVLDADALNILAQHPDWWDSLPRGSILTPHPGEMQRLVPNLDVHTERLESARWLASKTHCVIVLKGAGTLIVSPEGKVRVCTEGNPVLATAGTGDLLTGIIGSLLAQGLAPIDAASCGVIVHALAADRLALKLMGHKNENGRLFQEAGKFLNEIPKVLKDL